MQKIYTTDIDDQSAGNFTYDAIGNLISDAQSTIDNINWTVYGKIKSIKKSNGDSLIFVYDASGNRVMKTVKPNSADPTVTYYIKDASGNALSVYERTTNGLYHEYKQKEASIYGSSRIGISQPDVLVKKLLADGSSQSCIGCVKHYWTIDVQNANGYYTRELDKKLYELSDHLGNVRVTVGDQKYTDSTAQIKSYSNYYAFGSPMPGRTFSSSTGYRYGFNGQEKVDEISGSGNHLEFRFRGYDPRIGKFWSVDPLAKKYAWNSPYAFAENDVIRAIDLEGLERNAIINWYENGKYTGSTFIKVPDNLKVDPNNQGVLIVNVNNNLKPSSNPASTQFYTEVSNVVFFKNEQGQNTTIGGIIVSEPKNSWDKAKLKLLNDNPQEASRDVKYDPYTVNFEDPSNVTNPTNPEVYQGLKNTLKNNPEYNLNIEGNASKDDGVSESVNKRLSDQRSQNVKSDILQGGASTGQINTTGNGSSNATTSGNPADRNAIITIDRPQDPTYD